MKINKNILNTIVILMTVSSLSGCNQNISTNNTAELNYIENSIFEKYKKAEKLLLSNSYEEALKYYNDALDILSDNPQSGIINISVLSYNIAYCYENTNDIQNAIKYYNIPLELEDRSISAMSNAALGNIYWNKKEYEQCERYYLKAIELDPELYQAYVNLSALYSVKKDYDSGLKLLDKAIQIAPDKSDAYINRCYIYAALGNEKKLQSDIATLRKLKYKDLDLYIKIFSSVNKEG